MRLYEMRREPKTREARDLLNFQFWPKSYDDIKEVQKNDNPMNFAWRQLNGYWEMVFGMAANGIVNADYLVENSGEGIFHFAKVAPYLEQLRADGSPRAFHNVEWATKESELGRQTFAFMKEYFESREES